MTAILLLALGIGANTAIFSVLDEVLIRPLPVQRPRELALVRLAISPRATFQGAARLGFVSVREFLGPNAGIPFPVFDALRRTNQVFSGVLAEGPRTTVELQGARETGDAGLAHAAFVSGNYFSVLGLAPAAGRLFVDADDDRARGVGVVISHRYWERHFGRDPNVAGAAVFLNDISATVLGVAPAAFDGSAPGNPTDVWIPLAFRPGVAPAAPPDLTLIGRVRPGTTPRRCADEHQGSCAVAAHRRCI